METRLQLLAETSELLASPLDYEATLRAIARLAVPRMADWCAVHVVVDSAGALRTLAVAHADPEKVRWAEELASRYPPDPAGVTGLAQVVRSGRSELYGEVEDDFLVAVSRDSGHAALLRQMRPRSVMLVPMRARSGVLGAITLVAAESGRRYDERDLAFAEELAHRAALAVENARLYEAAETDRREIAALLASAGEGLTGLDMDGNCRFINPAGAALLGYTVDELLGRSMHDLVHHSHEDGTPYPRAECRITRTVRSGAGVRGEDEVFWRKDGTSFPVAYSAYPLIDGEETRGAVVAFRDITERRRSERELREYGERLENLWTLGQAIVAARSSNDIAAAALDGLARLLPGCDWTAVFVVDERTEEAVFLATRVPGAAASREPQRRPVRDIGASLEVLRCGDIQRIDDLDTLDPLPPVLRRLRASGLSTVVNVPMLDQGRLVGAVSLGAVAGDVLPAKRLEIAREVAGQIAVAIQHDHLRMALEEYAAELEERVRQRTAQLEAANAELEAFSYSVSHDLRAPLRSIDGFSQALLEDYADRLDEAGADYLRRVRRSTQRMGQLIDDLLTLSRITRSELRWDTVDLTALAHEVAAELQRASPGRDVRFEAEEGLVATGDRQLLRVALENLLGNAWKFTSRRSPAVVEFFATEADGERVFVVRDNGAGFDMAYAGKLFAPFQRLHGIHEFEGTGIGLATVQRVVRRHGGDVRAHAEVDRGATFSFTLPQTP